MAAAHCGRSPLMHCGGRMRASFGWCSPEPQILGKSSSAQGAIATSDDEIRDRLGKMPFNAKDLRKPTFHRFRKRSCSRPSRPASRDGGRHAVASVSICDRSACCAARHVLPLGSSATRVSLPSRARVVLAFDVFTERRPEPWNRASRSRREGARVGSEIRRFICETG